MTLALTFAVLPVVRSRDAVAAWNTVLFVRMSQQARTCGLIAQMFSPAAPEALRDYIRNSCARDCVDGRNLVDVVVITPPSGYELLAGGGGCEGPTFSVLNPHAPPMANPPDAVLQVVLEPRGPDRFDFGVRIAGYSVEEGANGIMLCGEYSGGRATYRGRTWRLQHAPDARDE